MPHAGLSGAIEKILIDAESAPAIASREVGDKSDRQSITDDARGASITHECGDERIGTVIELLGSFLDLIAGGIGDIRLVAKSAGGGHDTDASFLGDLLKSDLSLGHGAVTANIGVFFRGGKQNRKKEGSLERKKPVIEAEFPVAVVVSHHTGYRSRAPWVRLFCFEGCNFRELRCVIRVRAIPV